MPDAIASLPSNLSEDAGTAVLDAERAVSELQLNTTFAGLEALSRQLLRTESIASSRIEGLRLSQRRLAEALLSPADADAAAREVVGNIEAMQAAIELGGSGSAITSSDIERLHHLLLRNSQHASIAGKLRTEQNWIGGSDHSPRGAEFIPPPEGMVPGLMEDLAEYLDRADVSAVVQAAIAHAQFETIHPFADGNGRVGRALVHVVFRRRGLSNRFTPPISIVLAANGVRYVEGLDAYRQGSPSDWVRFFARVTVDAAQRSEVLAADLAELQSEWLEMAGRPRSDSTAARLIEAIPGQAIIDAKTVATMLTVSDVAARNALNGLQASGVLRPIVFGKQRFRAWEAPALIALLDTFEWSMAEPTRSGAQRRPSPDPR
ncbi:MAG: Fic family protein [Chloroflexi bacterium]|nr:Fic family protein [Chloroflexota bacterium]